VFKHNVFHHVYPNKVNLNCEDGGRAASKVYPSRVNFGKFTPLRVYFLNFHTDVKTCNLEQENEKTEGWHACDCGLQA
jgi:hypothetical protein